MTPSQIAPAELQSLAPGRIPSTHLMALERRGLSHAGARQLLAGEVVADPRDRQGIIAILIGLLGGPGGSGGGAGHALHAEKNQDITVENDEAHWARHDPRWQTVRRQLSLSTTGEGQLLGNLLMTSARDRAILAEWISARLRGAP